MWILQCKSLFHTLPRIRYDTILTGARRAAGAELEFKHKMAYKPRTIISLKILHDKSVHSSKINFCVTIKKKEKLKK